MRFLAAIFILFFSTSIFAQTGSKESRAEFEKKFTEQTAFISECKRTIELESKSDPNIKPRFLYNCEWNSSGCPVNLPKPFYPEIAKRYKFSGAVFVEVFLDENGNAVYAKTKSGNKIFYKSAEFAAYYSKFRAISYCERKILRKKFIVYNFILN